MALVNLPKVTLGLFPTPLQELSNLSKILKGPSIFAKREDLTGFASGGNKERYLQYILADIRSSGADTIISTDDAQANLALHLSASAGKLGMNVGFVFYEGQHPEIQGNLLLHQILETRLKILKGDRTSGEYASNVDKELNKMAEYYIKMGHKPVVIRPGISPRYDALAVLGWVDGAQELYNQLKTEKINAQYLVVATSGCDTLAGLTLGLKLLKSPLKIIGISTNRNKEDAIQRTVDKISIAADFMDWKIEISSHDLIIYDEYIGTKYGAITKECLEAIKIFAHTEGIFLDPVYTGKSMAGLIDLIKQGAFTQKDTIVFIHSGGFPTLFAYNNEIVNYYEGDDIKYEHKKGRSSDG